jgi:hypothetical protein
MIFCSAQQPDNDVVGILHCITLLWAGWLHGFILWRTTYYLTWAHERAADHEVERAAYHTLARIDERPAPVDELVNG